MGTVQTILFPIVNVEDCCPPGAILTEEVNQLQERHDTHAIICCAKSRRDRVKVGRE